MGESSLADLATLGGDHEHLRTASPETLPDADPVASSDCILRAAVEEASDEDGQHGVTFVGPPPDDNQWQARTEGVVTIEQFDLDWDRQIATCPAGQTSESRIPDTNGGHDNDRIRFSLT